MARMEERWDKNGLRLRAQAKEVVYSSGGNPHITAGSLPFP